MQSTFVLLSQMWILGGPFAAAHGFGAVYVGISFVLLMCMNLGRRKPGEASAYSIFNNDFRRLPGLLPSDYVVPRLIYASFGRHVQNIYRLLILEGSTFSNQWIKASNATKHISLNASLKHIGLTENSRCFVL